jgi:hypothetical protein
MRIDQASACARAAFLTLPWRHCGGLGAHFRAHDRATPDYLDLMVMLGIAGEDGQSS